MKKMIAVLLAVLIIGTAPAFAIPHGETADAMAVKGKGADVASASELVEAVESRQATGAENETLTANVSGTNTTMSDDPMQDATFVTSEPAVSTQNITMSDEPAPAEATGADTQLLDEGLDSVVSENEDTQDLNVNPENDTIIAENETIPQIDTSGIVMQSTDYSCGPAALATVLQNMGINSTEQELKVLAGTDTSGTSMYGLARAAQSKGLSAAGMRLSVDDLKPNNIVHIMLDGEGHYSVIREISNESVYLADPSLGNIEMTREKFAEIFTGNALVISNPNMQVNQTAEQANNSTENLTDQIDNVTNQTDQMQDLTNSTDANGATERTNNQDNENTTLIGPVANVTNTNSTNLLTKNTNNLTNEEMLNIKGKSWLFPLWFGIEIGYRYATHNRYGAVDGWCWASELISGVDINKDGWVGVPDEARRFGVNGEGYRVKAASKIKKSKKRKK